MNYIYAIISAAKIYGLSKEHLGLTVGWEVQKRFFS